MTARLPISPAAFGDRPPEAVAVDRESDGRWENVLYARLYDRTLEFDVEPGDRLRIAGVVLGPEVPMPGGGTGRGMVLGDWLDLGVVADA